jgi:outer membrane receptor protein involved in Fe transport
MTRHRAALLFALLLAARPLTAADISGRAADMTGAALPTARVRAVLLATGWETTVLADEQGRFRLDGLEPGTYRVTVEFEGLSPESRVVQLERMDQSVTQSFLLEPSDLLEEVTVTATRGERDALLVPVRTDTLAREELNRQRPTSTGDALVLAPGVTPVGSGPFQVRPRMRGLDSTRLLVLVDGERLNNARTATDRAGTEVGLADLATIEAVEVVGGSGSVLYGTDALAGTVNIVTNQPRFSDVLRFSYGFDGFYTSNEHGGRGTVTLGAAGRRLAIQFAGTIEDFGNYRAGDRGARESSERFYADGTLARADTIDDAFGFRFGAFPDPFNAPFARTSAVVPFSSAGGSNINASALFAISDAQTVQVKYIRRRMENVGFPDFEPPTFFARTSLPYSNLDRVAARYEARSLAPWLTSLRVNTYWQDQRRLLRTEFPVQFPVPSPAFFPINVFRLDLVTDTEQHVRTPGVDVQASLLPWRNHVLTVGSTFYRDASQDARTNTSQTSIVGNVALGPRGPQATVHPTAILVGGPSVSHPTRVPDASFADIGVFAQDEWEIARHLRLVAGLRVDRYQVRTQATPGYDVASLVEGARPAIDPATLPNEAGDRIARTAVTGDVGVVVRPNDVVSLTARYGRSYRHANLEELLFSGPATVGNIIPNVTVEPETGHNVDVGVKVRHRRASGSASYFNNTYDGFISTEIVATSPAGALSQALNFTDVRIQGIEADAEWPLVVRPGVLTLFGAFAWTHGRVLGGANPLTGASLAGTPADNITPWKLMPGARFADARDRYWLEYRARLQGEVTRVAPTLIESPYLIAQDLLSLQGFSVQRLAGGVNLGSRAGRLGVSLAVENVGDTFYREHFQFAPARGRTVTLGVTVRGR